MRTIEIPSDDEVERCRQVRRALEQTHGGLDGLCHWIDTLERKQGKNRVKQGGDKSPSRPSKARRQS